MQQDFWKIYQQTRFCWTSAALNQSSFSIVSARNPLGEIQSDERNSKLHQGLKQTLIRRQLSFTAILAGDASFNFTEMSFAIGHKLQDGISLAKQFNQNAMFWVIDDKLYLVPAQLEGLSKILLGCFSDRLVPHQSQ